MNLVKMVGSLNQSAGHPGGVGVVAVRLEGLGVISVPLGLGLVPLSRRGHVIQHLRRTFNLDKVIYTNIPIYTNYTQYVLIGTG